MCSEEERLPCVALSVSADADHLCGCLQVGRRKPDDADSDIDDAHSDSEDDDDDWAGDEVSTEERVFA